MIEVTELLMKKVQQKFPVMNVIKGEEGREYQGVTQQREIAGHLVTLVIGISNIIITKAELLE